MTKELKFLHITKTGGSSIENVGKEHNIMWGRFDNEYIEQVSKNVKYVPVDPWHLILYNKELQRKYDWFMVVRNPYTRILSEYYCKWGGVGKYSIKHTVEEMNKYIIKKINNRKMVGGHYVEQYKYLFKGSKITVLKFEKLDKNFNKLMIQYGYKDMVLPKINISGNKIFQIEDFSNELIMLINKIYHKDFQYFNYIKR
jgi:hypothetical protein